MEQTVCGSKDVENIMRRLRGHETPYTPPKIQLQPSAPPSSEAEELKNIVKVLGTKLKDAYQEISTIKSEFAIAEELQQSCACTIEQLQGSLASKDQETQLAKTELRQAKLTIGKLEHDIAELRTKNASPPPSPELPMLREELVALRTEQMNWQEERKRLEATLEQERQKGRAEASNNNGQLVRLAMSCKQLEEEVHSLKCERSATIRQFNQLKELNEEIQKTLATEQEKIQKHEEALAASTKTIQELLDTIEHHKATINNLHGEKEAAAQKEATLLAQISAETSRYAQEKSTCEALSLSLKAANDSFHSLTLQLEQERRTFRETDEKCLLYQKEKEASDARVTEVEELLIVKLQTITDLEEQLGEAINRCEDIDHRAQTAEQQVLHLTEDLQKTVEARDALHERALKQEQHIGRITTENSELKKRTESFERLKKNISEASSQARALLRTLDPGNTPAPSVAHRTDDLQIQPQEPSLFSERLEQHELF